MISINSLTNIIYSPRLIYIYSLIHNFKLPHNLLFRKLWDLIHNLYILLFVIFSTTTERVFGGLFFLSFFLTTYCGVWNLPFLSMQLLYYIWTSRSSISFCYTRSKFKWNDGAQTDSVISISDDQITRRTNEEPEGATSADEDVRRQGPIMCSRS